jgi:hypothetical protein
VLLIISSLSKIFQLEKTFPETFMYYFLFLEKLLVQDYVGFIDKKYANIFIKIYSTLIVISWKDIENSFEISGNILITMGKKRTPPKSTISNKNLNSNR